MAKKKVKKTAPKSAPKVASSSKSLFDLHPNLKWLLPLFLLLALGFIFAFKHHLNDEDMGRDNSAVIKQEVKDRIQNHANDDESVSPTSTTNQNTPEF